MEKSDRKWNIIIGCELLVYIVLTTAIFVVHNKLSALKQKKAEKISKNQQLQSQHTSQNIKKTYGQKQKQLEEALKKDKEDSLTRKKLAKFYYQQGKFKSSLTHYQKLVEQHPNDPQIHYTLGQLYMNQKGFEKKSLQHLQKVLQLDPAYPKKKIIELWITQLQKRQK